MGICTLFSRSSYDHRDDDRCMSPAGIRINEYDDQPDCSKCKMFPNPDPSNYEVRRYKSLNGHLLIEINYPDCTNYEGNKILLYKNTTLVDLMNQKHLDPHFSENKKFKSPFARFEPTPAGWRIGLEGLKII